MLDATLLEVARRQPGKMDDLYRVPELHSHVARRLGHALLRCVKRGLAAGRAPRPPRHRRPDDALMARYGALRSWRKGRAHKRGVLSDVIISKDMLWTLAKADPRTPEQLAAIEGLGPWKRKTYGAEILQVLNGIDGKGR
jgi:ribonuclease D